MTVSMARRRALGVILILAGIVVIAAFAPADRINGVTLLGILAAFVGVFLGTTNDRYVAHEFRRAAQHEKFPARASTYLHRPTCPCGRGALVLHGHRGVLRFDRDLRVTRTVQHARR